MSEQRKPLSQEDFETHLEALRDRVVGRLDYILELKDKRAPKKLLDHNLVRLDAETATLDRMQAAYQAVIATNGILALARASRAPGGAEDQDAGEPVGGYE